MKYEFNPEKTLPVLIDWIKQRMELSGGTSAVLGLSGGKDSSVTAALMAQAIGADNVYGILMPNRRQSDIEYAREIARLLKIQSAEIDIGPMVDAFYDQMADSPLFDNKAITPQTRLNLPPRVRLALMYAIAQSIDGARVINTSNMSEDWVGYATVYGDTAGAFSPLGMLTTEEVIAIGRLLEIPEKFLIKPPADGLTGQTDEMVLGFSYEVVNQYIREGILPEPVTREKIDRAHKFSRFKFEPIPMFDPGLPIKANQVGAVYPVPEMMASEDES